MKKVSIIIPTYNGQKTIRETLQSVFLQTYENYEIIVVDDGSTDTTVDFLKANFPLIRIIEQKNQGTLAARQAGINTAEGEYIAFLDQDDIWFKETLQKNVNILEKNPDIGLVLANMEAVDADGNPLNFNVVPDDKCYTPTWEELLLFHPIANSVAMFRTELIKLIGGLNSDFGFSGALGDTDTFCRMAEIKKVHFVNESLGYYRWSETRPGRLLSFLENLKIYAKNFWNHPRIVTKEDLRRKFVQACCNYGLHIYRLLLKQYDNEIPLAILESLNEHTKYMQSLFGEIYQNQIGLRPLDLVLFNLEKESTRTLLFIYLLRKDLQDIFPSVFNGSLDELRIWANEVANRKYVDVDFSVLSKYVRDFSYKSAELSPQKKWAIFRVEISQMKSQFRQKIIRAVHRVLPEGTKRRRFLYPLVLGTKVLFFEGWKSFINKTWGYIVVRSYPSIASMQKRVSHIKEYLVFSLNLQKKLIFPETNNPGVVIFVGLGENRYHNYICLKSILLFTKVPYQIYAITNNINVSDFKNIRNIVLHENQNKAINKIELYKQNRQYISNCKYVLFLDGNCVVTEDYLESMLSLLERNKCDVVSGKIVDAHNKTLLHAGGIISQGGVIKIRGLGEAADKPEYSFVHSIDIPAEECMLMRKDDLDKFCDEDVSSRNSSLNSILTKNNYKILIQPKAIIKCQVVGNFKSFSSSGEKTDQLIKNIYTKKWAQTTRILVLDDYIPAMRYGSGFPRLYEMLSCLSELGCFVTFFPVGNPVKVQPETSELQEKGIEVFWGQYANFESFMNENHNLYDIVLVSRPHVFERFYVPIKKNFHDSVIIYDAEALFYTREQAKAKILGKIENKNIESLAKQEMRLLGEADMVISVSPGEREIMLQQSSQKNIEVWSHVQNVKENHTLFNQRDGILFLGSFFAGQGSPNEDAALYFAKDIFPKILEKLDCKLYIVGANPTKAVKKLASKQIEVTGYVENLEDYFNKCRVHVVPTRFAAGIPLKLLQAMSHGIPTVVSELIASQLVLSDGKEVLVAQNTMEFAEKTMLLYSHETLWATISQNSLKFVLDNFSKSSMMKQMEMIIEKSLAIREQRQYKNSTSL